MIIYVGDSFIGLKNDPQRIAVVISVITCQIQNLVKECDMLFDKFQVFA